MAIDERARHRLHRELEEVLGPQEAAVLMAHLPPVGWADVATRHDLDHLREVLETRIEATEHKVLATFRAELIRQTHSMVLAQAGTVLAVAGLAFAAARLT
jgi:hypothetical protein